MRNYLTLTALGAASVILVVLVGFVYAYMINKPAKLPKSNQLTFTQLVNINGFLHAIDSNGCIYIYRANFGWEALLSNEYVRPLKKEVSNG